MRKSQASNEFYSTRGFSFLFLAFFLRFPVQEFPISVRCALNLFLKVRSPGLFVRNWLSHAAKFAVTSSCHRHHLLLISQIWRCDNVASGGLISSHDAAPRLRGMPQVPTVLYRDMTYMRLGHILYRHDHYSLVTDIRFALPVACAACLISFNFNVSAASSGKRTGKRTVAECQEETTWAKITIRELRC